MKTTTCLSLLSALVLTQCQLFKKEALPPLEQLPAATQEGKNTFGCLVNGQAWMPKGNNGRSNYSVDYDPTYYGGTFNLTTYRYASKEENNYQTITLYSDSLSTTDTYSLAKRRQSRSIFIDNKSNCTYISFDIFDTLTTYATGSLTITKLDLMKGIIAGTFEFTLAKPGCDTIRVTQGRFDKKL